jgi:heavy metal sensor kinase
LVLNWSDGLTLTTRLSMFFLATLALVLLGFSTAVYLLAGVYLHRQSEERLGAALNTLVASVEIRSHSVEWEPAQRHLTIGSGAFGDPIIWLVSDDQGRTVDQSKLPGTEDLLAHAFHTLRADQHSGDHLDWRGERWQFNQRYIQPTSVAASQLALEGGGRKYPALSITVGVSLEPVLGTLHRLALVLFGLSLGVWLLALFVGRLVCRRALLPVTQMASTAREMSIDDLERRLPASGTGDELEDLSRAFNNLLDRLQESFQRQKRFTGDASHQLRTPLAAMLGQAEVALRRDRPPEEYRRVLTTIHKEAGHLRRIVESLLFVARADNEARLPELERVNLNDWLPEHMQTWSEHSRAKDMVLECDAAGSNQVEVQPALLGELINILIDNACKFSQPGTSITVRLSTHHDVVQLQVQDRGFGISEADLAHVFMPFFRSADTRQRGIEGTGLGLSIAKRLAEAFGGALTASSVVGQGSSFMLSLPLVGNSCRLSVVSCQ